MKITSRFDGKCKACGGAIHAGETVEWERGAGVRHLEGKCQQQEQPQQAATVQMGVFRKDGHIYVVKPNRERTRVYAKEIIPSSPRLTEAGEKVDFETHYAPGIVWQLRESDRWDWADAKTFLTKYARCIVCGHGLKAAKSVEHAIGPMCAKYFGNRKAVA